MQNSRSVRLLLSYGLFAVLSQLVFIFLHVEIESHVLPASLLCTYYAPWLEAPLLSILLLLGGSYLIDLVEQKKEV